MVQRLELCAFTASGLGSVLGRELRSCKPQDRACDNDYSVYIKIFIFHLQLIKYCFSLKTEICNLLGLYFPFVVVQSLSHVLFNH